MKHFIIINILLYYFLSKVRAEDSNRAVKYPLPYYNQISPCGCDLTENKCDSKCCCDQDCPEDFHGNWTCIEGLYGGIDSGTFIQTNCSYEPGMFDPDWNSILCISSSRSAYLGLYYDEQIQPDSMLTPAKTSPLGDYSNIEIEKPMKFPSTYEYKHGLPLKVIYDQTQGLMGHLNFPYFNPGLGCVWSPIAYLNAFTSTCTKLVSPKLCQKNTMLDYQMYLMPLPPGMKVGNIPKVLKSPTNRDVTVPVFATYYAALEPELYVSTQVISKSNHYNPSDLHDQSFDNSESADNLNDILEEMKKGDDNVTPIFHGIANEKCAKLEQFSKNDQYQEDQVHFKENNDDNNRMCINAVLEVRYDIFWQGQNVTKIVVNVLLGNFSMIQPRHKDLASKSDFQHLHQIFSVNFKHGENQNTNDQENLFIISRSGNPGYDIGKPLISAKNISDKEIAFLPSPKLWSTSRTSKCLSSPLQSILFLKETQSACLVHLSKSNFTDCKQLAKNIKDILEELIDVYNTLIAKGGNMSLTNVEEFVKVIHEDYSKKEKFVSIANTLLSNNKVIHTCQVPSHLHVEVTYSQTSNIYRVNGVKINYFPEHWSWICSKRLCTTKLFELKSSVQFIQVPVIWHYQNTSKFWILQRLNLCEGDICWSDIFYPFTHMKDGDQVAFATMWGLTLIPCGLYLIWFLRGFW